MPMEFAMPIRVRWDADSPAGDGRPSRIARRIREIAPLFVEIRVHGEGSLPGLPGLLRELRDCNPRVTVPLRLHSLASSSLGEAPPAECAWELDAHEPFPGSLPVGAQSLSFTPDEDTIRFLPDHLAGFASSPAAEMHLPNINVVRALARSGRVAPPRPGRLQEVAGALSRSGGCPPGKRLVVHDYFLWRALRTAWPQAAGERVEFSGCQAGTALAHVDPEGNVYPCDSLPVRLGNLLETSFERIWASPRRGRIVEEVRAVADACRSCGVYSACLGGCRGLARVAWGSWDGRDPSCAGRSDGAPEPGDRS